MYWSHPQLLGRSFQKVRNFTAILFYNFHFIGYLVLTTRGATTTEKLKFCNWFGPWNACCLLGYTSPREPTNERCSHRMQDLASEFTKKFSGVTPSELHSGRGLPPPAPTPSLAYGRRGAQAPQCWEPNLSSNNFSAVVTTLRRLSPESSISTEFGYMIFGMRFCRTHWSRLEFCTGPVFQYRSRPVPANICPGPVPLPLS